MNSTTVRRWLVTGPLLATLLLAGTIGSASARVSASTKATIPNGGTVTIPIIADPIFNPWNPAAFLESLYIYRTLFDGLTKPGLQGKPVPDLATSWKASKNGLSWTFNLRKGVKWHDGKPFTSADVAYTFNTVVLDPQYGANGRKNFLSVTKVTTPNKYTAVFQLNHPFSALPAYLAYNAGILPEHVLSGKDPFKDTDFNKAHPVGTGPFKMASYIPGQSVELVANKSYFLGAPLLHALIFKVIPDANAQIAQMLSGDLTYLPALSDYAVVSRVKGDAAVRIRAEYIPQFYWLALHQTNPIFQQAKVRQAIQYALDRKAMIKNLLHGYGVPAIGPISPSLKYYYDPKVKQYPYDPKKAKQLMSQAGWKMQNGVWTKNGKPFSFTLDIGQQGFLVPAAELVQSYLQKIGMDVKINSMEWNAMIQKDIIQRNFDAALNWWTLPPDPDVFAYFASSAASTGNNIPGFQDPKLDKLLTQGETASQPAKRKSIYDKMQKYMAETLPYNFLFYAAEVQVLNKKLKGMPAVGSRDTFNYTYKWYLSK